MLRWVWVAVFTGQLTITAMAVAQEARLEVGSEMEDYLRTLQVRGLVPGTPFTIRSLSLNESARLIPDSAHPWMMTHPLAASRVPQASPGVTVFTPGLSSIFNSAYARSANDGAVWAGKGATVAATGGVRLRWGPVSATLLPLAYHAANRRFPTVPSAFPELSPYAYPWAAMSTTIDYPQRFGDRPLTRLDWGQSNIRISAGSFTTGVGTENLWLGPGMRNAIILSNTAPGFPHVDVGTSRPVGIGIGTLAITAIYGELTESAFFDTVPGNNHRFWSGIVLNYHPRWIPGLHLGVQRVLTRMWSELNAPDFVAPLGGIFNRGRAVPVTGGEVNDSADQLVSVHARWLFPSAGFEAYVEWARNDFSGDLRDFVLEPDHSAGFTAGFLQTLGTRRITRIRGEATHLGRLLPFQIRASPIYYRHTFVPQGYTHQGQLLGAAIGPGSNSTFIGVDRFDPGGRLGGFVQWVRYDDDAYFANFPERVQEGHDVEVAVGVSAFRFLGPFDIGLSFTLMRDLNRYYVIRNDVTNVNLQTSVLWRHW